MAAPDDAPVAWVSHPVREEPVWRGGSLVAVIVVVGWVVSVAAESGAAGAGGSLLLFLATSRYFLPSRYAVGPGGFTVSHAGRRRTVTWDRVARIVAQPDGIFLSPFPRPSRLDTFQGWFLRTPGAPDTLAEQIRRWADET